MSITRNHFRSIQSTYKMDVFFPVKFSDIIKPVNILHFNTTLPLIGVHMQKKSVNMHRMTIELHGINMTLNNQFITPVFL
jgi:hypothetical protein